MKALVKVLKNILLLPVLPIRLGWRWSSGAKASTKGALFNKYDKDGKEIYVEKGGCFPRLVGTVIIAGIMYSVIGLGIQKIVSIVGGQ